MIFYIFLLIFFKVNWYLRVPTGKTHAYYKCEKNCFCKLTIRQPILLTASQFCVLHLTFTSSLSYEVGCSCAQQDCANVVIHIPQSYGFMSPIVEGRYGYLNGGDMNQSIERPGQKGNLPKQSYSHRYVNRHRFCQQHLTFLNISKKIKRNTDIPLNTQSFNRNP